jgi:anti-anti-sigma regulatory factor
MNRCGDPQLFSEEHTAAQTAALLFAAGFTPQAIALLESEVAAGGKDVRQSHLVLFDLYHAAGMREAFDELLSSYHAAFPDCPSPSWGFPASIATAGALVLEGVLDQASKCVADLWAHGASRRTMAIDMSRVERIGFDVAGHFAACLRVFHVQGKRVILANISALHSALFEALGVDQCAAFLRRRGSDAKPLRPVARVESAPLAEAAA